MKYEQLLFMIFIPFLFILSGCSSAESSANKARSTCYELIDYINDHNCDGVKSLLSDYLKNDKDIDNKIEKFVFSFPCYINTDDIFSDDFSSGHSSWRDGECVESYMRPAISFIYDNKEYHLAFQFYIISSNDTNKTGIDSLTLEYFDNDIWTIVAKISHN